MAEPGSRSFLPLAPVLPARHRLSFHPVSFSTPALPALPSQDLLIDQTRARFAPGTDDSISITPIEKGGSERIFYRVQMANQSLILVKYNNQREENRHYVQIARAFDALGVRAPKILFPRRRAGPDLDGGPRRARPMELPPRALARAARLLPVRPGGSLASARTRLGGAGEVSVHGADRVQRGALPLGAEILFRPLPGRLLRAGPQPASASRGSPRCRRGMPSPRSWRRGRACWSTGISSRKTSSSTTAPPT